MKRMLIVLGAVVALALSGSAVALAADTDDAVPSCGQALSELADARVKANAGDDEIADLKSDQADLDRKVREAQDALDHNADATKVAELTVALNKAKAAADANRDKLEDKVRADDILNDKAADAQKLADKACKGAPAPVDNRICADFTNHAAAQEALRAGNPRLDIDGDGIACELGEGQHQVKVIPKVAPSTGWA
jgi:hypothetical protein